MAQLLRVLIAIGILVSGILLLPTVELPQETFQWQRYANVYEQPLMVVNHSEGQAGSFFTFTGLKFPENTPGSVTANGTLLGTITTDAGGGFVFLIDSTNGGDGSYTVTVSVGGVSASAVFNLDASAPLQPQEGSGPIFMLPAGIEMHKIFLPMISR